MTNKLYSIVVSLAEDVQKMTNIKNNNAAQDLLAKCFSSEEVKKLIKKQIKNRTHQEKWEKGF